MTLAYLFHGYNLVPFYQGAQPRLNRLPPEHVEECGRTQGWGQVHSDTAPIKQGRKNLSAELSRSSSGCPRLSEHACARTPWWRARLTISLTASTLALFTEEPQPHTLNLPRVHDAGVPVFARDPRFFTSMYQVVFPQVCCTYM